MGDKPRGGVEQAAVLQEVLQELLELIDVVLSVTENAYECGSLGSFVPTRSVSVPADEEVQIWGGTLPTKGA
jgi:hypothetical protein